MHYSNIRSRAGLVALVFKFALINSLVSAVPIPATESGLSATVTLPPRSNPSLNGQKHIRSDNAKISLSGRMSTLPAATRALTRGVRYCPFFQLLDSIYWASWLTFIQEHISTGMDDQLVPRKFSSGIKHIFRVCLNLFSLKAA